MRFSSRTSRSHGLLLDMTPMIDIVFLLLIFFLTTAQLARNSRADIDLPEERGEQREQIERAGLIVNVLADGSIVEGERTISIEELEIFALSQVVMQESNGQPIRPLVRADRNAPAERLNQVFETLRRAGIRSARLATSPKR